MCHLIASALGALIGCTDATAPDPADLESRVHATRSAGRRATFDELAIEAQAYVAADRLPGAGDCFVTDEDGAPLSQNAVQCRRVHIDTSGGIDVAYDGFEDGDRCHHRCRFAVGGGLTLQLVPSGNSATQHYRALVSPRNDVSEAVGHAFAVSDP